ncbi:MULTISPECIES: hypothetical protein [unclassified Burkholderia]|uniref:hypothetical protein n=1 Tax=unclassified Burkholderia TaxID=2613784 RepID=UPI0015884330|nr:MULTISPECIES: hypothetical protein [unclassified Burkholderia]
MSVFYNGHSRVAGARAATMRAGRQCSGTLFYLACERFIFSCDPQEKKSKSPKPPLTKPHFLTNQIDFN